MMKTLIISSLVLLPILAGAQNYTAAEIIMQNYKTAFDGSRPATRDDIAQYVVKHGRVISCTFLNAKLSDSFNSKFYNFYLLRDSDFGFAVSSKNLIDKDAYRFFYQNGVWVDVYQFEVGQEPNKKLVTTYSHIRISQKGRLIIETSSAYVKGNLIRVPNSSITGLPTYLYVYCETQFQK